MSDLKLLAYRFFFYAASTSYAVWAIHRILVNPTSRSSFLFIISVSIFFFVYMLPLTVFQARIDPEPDGLHVRQYRSVILPYSDVKYCVGLFLVPFPTVVVVTSRSFPLNLLISGDEFTGPPKSLIQDGRLATSIKAMIRAPAAKTGGPGH
jgi:hypothetical protein